MARRPRSRKNTSTTRKAGGGKGPLIRRLLVNEGIPVREAAARAGVSVRYVSDYAWKHQLPTNPPIRPNSREEMRLCRSLSVLMAPALKNRNISPMFARDFGELARAHRHSPSGLLRVVSAIQSH